MKTKKYNTEDEKILEKIKEERFKKNYEKISRDLISDSDVKISKKLSTWVDNIFQKTNEGLKRVVLLPNWKKEEMNKNYVGYYVGRCKFHSTFTSKNNGVVTSLYKINNSYKEVVEKLTINNMKELKNSLNAHKSKKGICMETYGKSPLTYFDVVVNKKNKLKNDVKCELKDSMEWKSHKSPLNKYQGMDMKPWFPKFSKNGSVDIIKVKKEKVNGVWLCDSYICIKSTAPDFNLELIKFYSMCEQKGVQLSEILKSGVQDLLIESSIRNNNAIAFQVALNLGIDINYTEDLKSYVSHSSNEMSALMAHPNSIQVSNYFVKMPDLKLTEYMKYLKKMNTNQLWAHNFVKGKKGYDVYAYMRNCILNEDYNYSKPRVFKYKKYVLKNVKKHKKKTDLVRRVKIVVEIPNGFMILEKDSPVEKFKKYQNSKTPKPAFMAIPVNFNKLDHYNNEYKNIKHFKQNDQNNFENKHKYRYHLMKLSDKEDFRTLPIVKTNKHKILDALNRVNLRCPYKKSTPLIKIIQ